MNGGRDGHSDQHVLGGGRRCAASSFVRTRFCAFPMDGPYRLSRNIGASLFWRRCGCWGLDSRSRGPLHPQIPLCRSKAQGGTTYCRAIVTRTSGQTRTGAILRLPLFPREASARNGRLPGLFGQFVSSSPSARGLLDDLKNLAHLLERHVELFLNATYRFGVLSVQSNVHESSSGKFPLGPG